MRGMAQALTCRVSACAKLRMGDAMSSRMAAVLLASGVVSGCTIVEEPKIVTGAAKEVTVIAGTPANPGPLAAQHCAKYGKEAALRGSDLLEPGSGGGQVFNWLPQAN